MNAVNGDGVDEVSVVVALVVFFILLLLSLLLFVFVNSKTHFSFVFLIPP